VIAGELAEGGLSVAVAEEDLVGGECSYYACMPSKALLRSPDIRAEVSRVAGVADPNPDVGAVLARRDAVVHDLDDTGQPAWLVQRVADRAGESADAPDSAPSASAGAAPCAPSSQRPVGGRGPMICWSRSDVARALT
jgi:pyruvate/2-oxoglutarate dehydrogenase complex dihydrolipoamide dehydrogenase (E3) component